MLIWELCECCEEFWCCVHGMHVHDCPCPPIEVWYEANIDPYNDHYTTELEAWIDEHAI